MNKILKILSILIIGFVMFSCSTPTNDPTPYVPEPSSPEIQTYSITFTSKTPNIFVDYLNTLPEFKNLKEGKEVPLLKYLYTNDDASEITKKIVKGKSAYKVLFQYYFDNSERDEIDSVVIGNEDVEVEVTCEITDKLE